LDKLTDRELEILKLLSEGWTIKEISKELCCSYSAIDNRRSRMFDKLKAVSNSHAVAIAFREGILE